MREKKTPMRKQGPEERTANFSEVALGYDDTEAVEEAARCIKCRKAPCVNGCPVGIDIPAFVALVAAGRFDEALAKIQEKNALPAICGRVCPQETQCEELCTLGRKWEPVAIGRLERFVADRARERHGGRPAPAAAPAERRGGPRAAVVGAGPAGLTCAAELAKNGVAVTLYESLHMPGGVLTYGIPEFRLPKKIVRHEVDYIRGLGVELATDTIVGKTVTVDELLADGFDAVFIGSGAGLPSFMGIPGENLLRVYSANEFLTRVNLMRSYDFPRADTPIDLGARVAVIGGGNVAMDSARCALRLGAEKVEVLYRRTEAEMPARREEYENAVEEGVRFSFLVAPLEIVGDDRGYVAGVRVVRNELGEPDESGRRRPVPVPGSETVLDFDTVVVAIGQNPNPLVPRSVSNLKIGRHGTIVVDEETGFTGVEGIYAGGDIATGAATVISAMGAGKRAAAAILARLAEKKTGPAAP